MSMSDQEIFAKVQEVLEEALGVDADEVTPTATIGEDLGAESIDYLDISFRLEKAFGIKIGETEMFDQSVLSNPQYVQDGKVTAEGLSQLKAKMPHADWSEFEADPQVDNLPSVFTVEMICKFVKAKIS